jgi:magnesium-transporting ATPase (P-type)
MSVAMITGDAILTAAHVAKEVGICDPDVVADELQLLLRKKKKIAKRPILLLEDGSHGAFCSYNMLQAFSFLLFCSRALNPFPAGLIWKSYDDGSEVEQFSSAMVGKLASQYDLATTGKNLAIALENDKGTSTVRMV